MWQGIFITMSKDCHLVGHKCFKIIIQLPFVEICWYSVNRGLILIDCKSYVGKGRLSSIGTYFQVDTLCHMDCGKK